MNDLNSIFAAAQQLPPDDQLRLINALWDAVPEEAEMPLHESWATELEKRVERLEAGAATTVPWSRIREEALARIGRGTIG